MANKLGRHFMLLSWVWQLLHAQANLVVNTVNGPVQGVYRDLAHRTASWWGIPYAEPPVGNRRFRAPQPLKESWAEPRQANQIPPACPSRNSVQGTEDCLFLNVHAPAPSKTNKTHPVMVWFYGGGFSFGDSYSKGLYDGQHLAWKHEAVVVTLNYRLLALGFMALDALQDESATGSTGNHALQDQQLALRWVQANILNFGGDPTRVTIFGESAGAFSVMWHLVSPRSAGLFHGAIMESGTVDISFFFQPVQEAKRYYEDLATRLNCSSFMGAAAQLACLRKLPVDVLLGVEVGLDGHRPAFHSPLWPLMPNGPAIDGTEDGLVDVPIRLVQRGEFNKVPLLLGANENGGSIFEDLLPKVLPGAQLPVKKHPETLDKALAYFFGSNITTVKSVYTEAEFNGDGDVLIQQMIRDLMFMCPLRSLSSTWTAQGLPAFMYVFDFPYGLASLIGLGDFHGAELPFVFRNWLELIKPIDVFHLPRHMADIMSCKWTSFASTLDPNGGDDEQLWPPGCQDINRLYSNWPRFHSRQRLFYTLKGRPEVRQILSDNRYPDDLFPRDPKCDLWDVMASSLHFTREGTSTASPARILV